MNRSEGSEGSENARVLLSECRVIAGLRLQSIDSKAPGLRYGGSVQGQTMIHDSGATTPRPWDPMKPRSAQHIHMHTHTHIGTDTQCTTRIRSRQEQDLVSNERHKCNGRMIYRKDGGDTKEGNLGKRHDWPRKESIPVGGSRGRDHYRQDSHERVTIRPAIGPGSTISTRFPRPGQITPQPSGSETIAGIPELGE